MRSMCKATLVLLVLALAFAVQVQAQTQTPTDIGDLGGGWATPYGTAPGYVCGSSPTGGSVDVWGNPVGHAFLWSASTGMQDIAASIPNAGYSRAISVNSHGEVAGLYYALDYSSATGFFWSQATGVVTIGPVSGVNGGSMVMNESGVVGSVTPDGRAFRWTQAGGVQDLGTSDFSDLSVSGINSQGDIVGNYWSANGYNGGFIAWAGGTRTNLHSPSPDWPYNPPPQAEIHMGQVDLVINGINDSGVVVGTYWDFGYIYSGYDISQGGFFNAGVHNSHAFKWTLNEGFTDLGNFGVSKLTPGSPVTFGASANAINNSGKIVGYSHLPNTGNAWGYDPFVYDGGMTRLPGLYVGDDRASATGINDDGVVVGYANSTASAVMWVDGVLTNLVPIPTLPLQWPGAPLINGSMLAGGGVNNNWQGRTWTMALPRRAPADTTAPVITVPGNRTVEATGPGGAPVNYSASAIDAVDGAVSVSCSPASGSTFPLGTTSVTCTASDAAHNNATASFTVSVVDTTAPSLNVPSSKTAEATSSAGAVVTYTVTATDAVTASPTINCTPASGSTFPLGNTIVNCTAKDAAGNSTPGSFSVAVRDTIAPVITSVTPSTASLWPPNHQMVPVTISVAAFDAVGATVKIVSVTSSEPDDGLGDGDTANDIQITGALSVSLRAERSGKGNGRIYTITVEAKDAAGNATRKTTTVSVPKNQSGK